MRLPGGFHIDNPAFHVVRSEYAYIGRTSALGGVDGLSLICADLANEPNYAGQIVKIFTGPSAGQIGRINTNTTTMTAGVSDAFTTNLGVVNPIGAGTEFGILRSGDGLGASFMALINAIYGLTRPSLNLFEGWQNEAGIDPNVWTVTNPATGGAWVRGAVGSYLMAVTSPNANENGRLRSNQRWICEPGAYGANQILRKFNLEFEIFLQLVADIDQANFFVGLTDGVADTRIGNNIIGFGLLANVLQAITDDAGAETVTALPAVVPGALNKLKIEVSAGRVRFLVNEVVVATHVTNLPNAAMYLNFYYPTGAGGPSILSLGTIRCWPEDMA